MFVYIHCFAFRRVARRCTCVTGCIFSSACRGNVVGAHPSEYLPLLFMCLLYTNEGTACANTVCARAWLLAASVLQAGLVHPKHRHVHLFLYAMLQLNLAALPVS